MTELDISAKYLLLFIESCEKQGIYPTIYLKTINDAEIVYEDKPNINSEKNTVKQYLDQYPVGIVSVDSQIVSNSIQNSLLNIVLRDLKNFINELVQSLDYNFSSTKENFYIKNELQDNDPEYYLFSEFVKLLKCQEKYNDFEDVFHNVLNRESSEFGMENKLFYKLIAINLVFSTDKIKYFTHYLKQDIKDFISHQINNSDDEIYMNLTNLAYFKTFFSNDIWEDKDIKNIVLDVSEKSSIAKKHLQRLFPYLFNQEFLMKYSEKKIGLMENDKSIGIYQGEMEFNISDFEKILTPYNYIKLLQSFEPHTNSKDDELRNARVKKIIDVLMGENASLVEDLSLIDVIFRCEEGRGMLGNYRVGSTIFKAAHDYLYQLNTLTLSFVIERESSFELKMKDKLEIKSKLLEVCDIFQNSDLSITEILQDNNLEVLLMEKQLSDNIPITNKIFKKLKF